MAATSGRNLVTGSGTVSGTATTTVLTFSNSQDFKPGATVKVGTQLFTIDMGADKIWETVQPIGTTITNSSFSRSDMGTGRGRGTSGEIVPNAMHYLYRAALDNSGNPDWYFYFDTLQPENGVHPYTKDQFTGQQWVAAKAISSLVPNLGLRVRVMEGITRGSAGDITDPDKRLDDMENRIRALEQWANGGAVPAVGSGAGNYTIDQLQSFGDIA